MTFTINTKIKNKFKNEHFNNNYKMLLKIKKELKLIDDAQFIKLTKKYYSLNIKNFKNMSKFLNKIKKLKKQIDVTKMKLINDKRTIICLMMTLTHDKNYRSLIQI